MMMMMITSMDRDHVSELQPTTGFLFIPRSYMSMENHGGIISTGKTPDSCTISLLQSYQQSHLVANQVTDGFISPPKNGVLRIFIALKLHRPLPDLNPRTLGPKASKLTVTLPRRRQVQIPEGVRRKSAKVLKDWSPNCDSPA
jgi:hypothetical protein